MLNRPAVGRHGTGPWRCWLPHDTYHLPHPAPHIFYSMYPYTFSALPASLLLPAFTVDMQHFFAHMAKARRTQPDCLLLRARLAARHHAAHTSLHVSLPLGAHTLLNLSPHHFTGATTHTQHAFAHTTRGTHIRNNQHPYPTVLNLILTQLCFNGCEQHFMALPRRSSPPTPYVAMPDLPSGAC